MGIMHTRTELTGSLLILLSVFDGQLATDFFHKPHDSRIRIHAHRQKYYCYPSLRDVQR